MKARHSATELVNLDLLSVSLLCCLLAAVLGALILREIKVGATESDEPARDWNAFHRQAAGLGGEIEIAERARKTVWDRVNFALLNGDNERLEAEITKLEASVDGKAKQKTDLLKEIERLSTEVARLERKQAKMPPRTEQVQRMFPNYKGPFVLVECTNKGATIYPGGTKLPAHPTDPQIAALIEQIVATGCVGIAVRPSAWSGGTFENLRDKIFETLETAGPKTLRTTFPVADYESIKAYLPPALDPSP